MSVRLSVCLSVCLSFCLCCLISYVFTDLSIEIISFLLQLNVVIRWAHRREHRVASGSAGKREVAPGIDVRGGTSGTSADVPTFGLRIDSVSSAIST